MKKFLINSEEELRYLLDRIHPTTSQHIGELLIQEGKLTDKQLAQALKKQRYNSDKHLGEIIVELGYCTQEQVTSTLSGKLGIPFVEIGEYNIPSKLLSLIPPDIALRYSVLPLMEHENRLVVAMENPLDWTALDVLRFTTNRPIDAVMTSHTQITNFLNRHYTEFYAEGDVIEMADKIELGAQEEQEDETSLQSIAEEAQKKPVVRLVNAIIIQGILHRASDINIRPEKERVNIYYRIDGKLHFSRSLHKSLLAPIVSRIKITGRMNIAERRLPQDGHTRVLREGGIVDLRISIIPTVTGESVVIRILDKRVGLKRLDQLGLRADDYRKILKIISRNNGIFLVTGPTGCGKSTTLYSILNEVVKREPHIITVEDPVEYDMQGIEQIQIQPITGYTFAEALKHILRHDPDVIMVGEIRDLETARIANKAALTGHLVFSTLHTNDAASAVTRLIDMGIEPYLLSSTMLAVMAQRLVRLNCQNCSEQEVTEPHIRHMLNVSDKEVFYKGKGCDECHGTGYQGRAAVCELLEMTPQLATMINNNASSQEIRQKAHEQGMVYLTQNALELAREGITSLEEVYTVRLE